MGATDQGWRTEPQRRLVDCPVCGESCSTLFKAAGVPDGVCGECAADVDAAGGEAAEDDNVEA